MDTLIGKQFNRYCLISRLGQGSFAQVYLAEHIFLKTLVAVKILRILLSDEEIEVFLNEARTIARLQHSHIVPIYDCGIEDGIPFLVTAYAPHGSLGHQYKGRRLPIDDILRYASQAAAALQYAHDQRVIHRDVKPDNMLLGPNNELWLSDFNLSLTIPNSRPLSLQEALGTPYYMAPEQINGKPCPASDQYALGVIVYEWLCGVRPFDGTSYGELFFQHLSKQPPSPRESVPLISPSIEAAVLKALAKDPLQRFPSIQAFADALKQAYAEDMHALAGNNGQQPDGKHKQVLANNDMQTLIPNSEQTLKNIPTQPRLTRRTMLAAAAGGGGILVLAAGIAGYLPTFFGSHSQAATGVRPTPSVGSTSKHQSTPTSHATSTPQSTPTPTPGTTITTYTGHSQDVKSVVWSPDGKRIVSGSVDKTIHIWDATTGKGVQVYTAHTDQVKSVSWSFDGLYLASCDLSGVVHVWNPISGKDVFASPYSFQPFEMRCVAWKPNAYVIASGGSDKIVQIWDATTGQRIQTYNGHVADLRSIAWSPDGTQIASGYVDGTLHVWNAATRRLVFSLDTGQTHEVWSVAWSQDGRQIAAACQSGSAQILVWDATTRQLVFSASVPAHIAESVAWSPDSILLAAGSQDGTVQIWNMGTKQLVQTYHQQTREIWSVAWSPDGKRMVSGSADGTAKVWWTVGTSASRPPNDIHPT